MFCYKRFNIYFKYAYTMAEHQDKKPQLNDQGRSEVTTGSTTQGGSNFGQGSSHLGGESYRQGSDKSLGANYENEANKFANSTTDSQNDPDQSPLKGTPGAQHANQQQGRERTAQDVNAEAMEESQSGSFDRKTDDQNHMPTAGDSGDTARDVDMNLDDKSEEQNR